MRQSDKTSRKYISEMKKLSVSEKTRSDNPSSHSNKEYREEPVPIFTGRGMKSLGRKYVQDNCFKVKQKEQQPQIVISDELVRNSKLYRMLKEKFQINQSIFLKQSTQLQQTKANITKQTTQIRSSNHSSKLALWELKNQILQLKGILNDQEEQTKRLQIELQNSQQYQEQEQEEEAQNEMPEQSQKPLPSQEADLEKEGLDEFQLERQSQKIRQDEVDIKMMMVQLHKKMNINPQNEKEVEEQKEEKEPGLKSKREQE